MSRVLDWLSRHVLVEKLLLYAAVIVIVSAIGAKFPSLTRGAGWLVVFIIAFFLAEAWRGAMRARRTQNTTNGPEASS